MNILLSHSCSFGPDLTLHWTAPQISFREGNAQELDLPSNTYDLYTVAFGIRNFTSVADGLKEAYRVLKPGGVFACLEFSRVTNPLFASSVKIFCLFSFVLVAY